MGKFEESLLSVHAPNRQVWRDWLKENHQKYSGVWLVYYKVKSPKPSIRYPEAVQEALCFGWIDSKLQSLDAESYQQVFTPRKPKSVWSKLNKQYVQQLIEQGLMTEAGLKAIAIAQENGSWNALDEVEALIIPDDLAQAFLQNQIAAQNYAKLSKSKQKNLLLSLSLAKQPQTRATRIQKIIDTLG